MLIILPMIVIYLWGTIDLANAYYMEYKQCKIWWEMITDYDICEYFCNYHAAFDESIKIPQSILTIIHQYYMKRKKNKDTMNWRKEGIGRRSHPFGHPYIMIQRSMTYSTTIND